MSTEENTKFTFCLAVDGAKRKNTRDAIAMLRILRDCLRDGEELTPDAHQYFVECLDAFLAGADKANTNEKMQRLISRSLNLTGLQGSGHNSILDDYHIARDIHDIYTREGGSLDSAIEKAMAATLKDLEERLEHLAAKGFNDLALKERKERLEQHAAGGDFGNLRRIYYANIEAVKTLEELDWEHIKASENKD